MLLSILEYKLQHKMCMYVIPHHNSVNVVVSQSGANNLLWRYIDSV